MVRGPTCTVWCDPMKSLQVVYPYGRNLLNHHQHTPPPELRIRSQVEAPSELLPIVKKLLNKFPSARYRNIADLRIDLEKLELPEKVEALAPIDDDEDSIMDFSMDGSMDFFFR